MVSAPGGANGPVQDPGTLTTSARSRRVNPEPVPIDGDLRDRAALAPKTHWPGSATTRGSATRGVPLEQRRRAGPRRPPGSRLALAWPSSTSRPGPRATPPAPRTIPSRKKRPVHELTQAPQTSIDFIEGVRVSMGAGLAPGAWTTGTTFAQHWLLAFKAGSRGRTRQPPEPAGRPLARSPRTHHQGRLRSAVQKLAGDPRRHRAAGVPELDLHRSSTTVSRSRTRTTNSGCSARRAARPAPRGVTDSFGHCTSASPTASRGFRRCCGGCARGQWVAWRRRATCTAATALALDPARFIRYSPGPLAGAVPSR